MSGIYIHGMEMPTTYPLMVTIYPDGQVLSETVGAKDKHGIAIPVPEHGRLGDLNELFKKMFVGTNGQCYPDKDVDGFDHVYTFRVIKHEILSAPTIIPADLPVMYYPQVDGITPTVIQVDKEKN